MALATLASSMRTQQALQREVTEMNLRMEQESEYHQERVVEVGVALAGWGVYTRKACTSFMLLTS